MWEYDWLHSTGYPAVFGRGENKHCHLGTWLESSSEVWSSTIWRREEDWGPLSKGTCLFLPIPAVCCISLHPETVLRWTRFFCVSDTVMAARTCRDWLAKRGGTFWCVWVRCSRKTNRRSFYLRGHPQTPVGDALTELPTKPEVDRRRRKKEKM